MKLLRCVGVGILVAGFALAAPGGAQAQTSNNNSQPGMQPGDASAGTSSSTTNTNQPYTPPAPPPGGYGNAETGSYSGRGTSGSGSGSYGATQSGSSGGYGSGQNGTPSVIGQIGKNNNPLAEDTPQNQQQMEMQQARARNAERQKQLLADTQKLVALANELQDEVNKSTKDMLSLDVVRKADEIDKLAKTVRDKMKNAD